MDFANIKESAEFKQKAGTEEPASLVFQEGFAVDIPGK